MGGGGFVSLPKADDGVVQRGEKLWRLLDPKLYQSDPNVPNSPKEVMKSAFSGDVSALRASLPQMTEAVVDLAVGGKFAAWGIIELDESELRSNGCALKLDQQPEWPPDTHVLVIKGDNGKQLNPTIKAIIAKIATSRIRRPPQ